MTMINRFTTKYQGRRYSFGYPACPALEDQAGIWKLLKPEEIGVQLTDRLHDGPGSQRECAGISSPGLRVFWRGGCGRNDRVATSSEERVDVEIDLRVSLYICLLESYKCLTDCFDNCVFI